jgi:hypothetical protein
MVDTPNGIRFAREPSMPFAWTPIMVNKPEPVPRSSETGEPVGVEALGGYICFPTDDDEGEVPPYVYFLMRQVEPCRFQEADRFVARSKGPIGFPGFQCRHCNGHAGLGKYFPLTPKALATNSTSQNIHAHILKCRKCPDDVKQEMLRLKEEKSKTPRLLPGWRKIFFDKLWNRLHGDEE